MSVIMKSDDICITRSSHVYDFPCRSEMHLATVSVRFGLMLEAFCRGCGHYMKELSDQYKALNKMKQMTDKLQKMKKTAEDLKKYLSAPHFVFALKNITSPLDAAIHCSELKWVTVWRMIKREIVRHSLRGFYMIKKTEGLSI